MKLKDLGEINTGVVLFGGPYSNLQATHAMLAQIETFKMPAICTGDVVAYCAHPAETVAAMRAASVDVIAGNCEKQLAEGQTTCGCGFDSGSACDLLSRAWFAHVDAQIGQPDRAWMRDLPDMAVFTQAGRRFAVIHGGVSDISRFLWSTSPEREFVEEVTEIRRVAGPIDGVIAGHSGISFARDVAGITWINAGVIGMPPNSGRSQTQFAVLQNGRARFHALDYDASAARGAMCDAGLMQGYHDALVTGYWPSEDVLPLDLRRPAVANG